MFTPQLVRNMPDSDAITLWARTEWPSRLPHIGPAAESLDEGACTYVSLEPPKAGEPSDPI